MKIVVCGSMSASKEMVDIEKRLIDLGHDVILPKFTHEYAEMASINKIHTESARNKVDYDLIRGYYDKIAANDAVLIANVERKGIDSYIGGNAFLEMGFAYVLNKPIYLFNGIPEMAYKDEIEVMEPIILNGNLDKI